MRSRLSLISLIINTAVFIIYSFVVVGFYIVFSRAAAPRELARTKVFSPMSNAHHHRACHQAGRGGVFVVVVVAPSSPFVAPHPFIPHYYQVWYDGEAKG